MMVYNEDSVTIVTKKSNRILFSHPNGVSLDVLQRGIPESRLIDWARQFGHPDRNFVDIGAHSGTWSISLSDIFSHVHSFEPQRRTYYQLCGGIALSLKENITAHNVALSDKSGQGQLNITSVDGGSSSLLTLPNLQRIGSESVKCQTLDDYKIDDIGLIKIDVEGHELAVLHGAQETLARNRFPPIIFEVWNDEWYASQKEKLFQYILQMPGGYKLHPLNGFPHMYLASTQ
jgi:FkbM family methyltransferase